MGAMDGTMDGTMDGAMDGDGMSPASYQFGSSPVGTCDRTTVTPGPPALPRQPLPAFGDGPRGLSHAMPYASRLLSMITTVITLGSRAPLTHSHARPINPTH